MSKNTPEIGSKNHNLTNIKLMLSELVWPRELKDSLKWPQETPLTENAIKKIWLTRLTYIKMAYNVKNTPKIGSKTSFCSEKIDGVRKKTFSAYPVEDFNTLILSHHWGLYDLWCGLDSVLCDFPLNSICQSRYTRGIAKSEKSASSTHFRSFQYYYYQ